MSGRPSFDTRQISVGFNLLSRAGRRGAVTGLGLAAEHVLQVSNESVPLEEGTLERSGVASVDPERLRAAVSYDTIYAVTQHEDLDAQHDSGRTAKYLENAMNSERDTIRQLIRGEIRKELQG